MDTKACRPNTLFRQVLENRGFGSLREIWLDFLTYLRAREYPNLEPFTGPDLVETAEVYVTSGVLDRLQDEENDMEAAWFVDFNSNPGLSASAYAFLHDRNLYRYIDKVKS